MKKKALPTQLNGDRIVLKKPVLKTADLLFKTIDSNRDRLRPYLPWVDLTQTVEDEIKYIKMVQKSWKNYDKFDYSIFHRQKKTYIGNIGTHAIFWPHRYCEIGFWSSAEFEGLGFVSEALTLLESALFELGFNRIEIRCMADNQRSARVALRNGYQFEGSLREQTWHKERFHDILLFAKLASDQV